MTPRSPAVAALPRRLAILCLLAGLLVGLLASVTRAQDEGPTVDIVEVGGLLDRPLAGYLTDVIAKASDSEVVVVQLDSPGGLGVDGQGLVEAVTASTVPVVVWVGPGGAQATGAAAVLANAAHVVALAPGSVYGAAAPADLRVPADEAMGSELADDLAVVAGERGRNSDFAAATATDRAVVVTVPATVTEQPDPDAIGVDSDDVAVLGEDEVVDRGYADLVATSLPAVLERLDGRMVTVADGAGGVRERTLDVDSATASVRFNNPGLLARVLHTIASPTLAYLLLIAGALTLVFEVFQPGFGVAGFCALILLALAAYGLVALPTNWFAFALLALGLILLAVDLAVAGLGLVTLAGTAAAAAGSWWLFDGPAILRLRGWLVALVVVTCVVYFVVVMTTVLRAQGNQAMAGAEQVVGKVGVVRSMLNPQGHIFVGGALWRARAPETAGRVKTGTRVRVVGMDDGLTLDVELVDSDDAAAASR